ncbi:hypothetical protein SAMN04487904_106233 [Actinopolyspora lacussalsi subsp. righensis]|uniref:Uncharacterized protein n=1 Tax=Actinopolyspora righensis TaxID=995060 RepID=A0A1I7ABK8_9ACTN|nr:hypothetical protein SAMN04487904_106233 [Actinopolyspora righensis]
MTQRNVTHSRTVEHSRAHLAGPARRVHRLSLGEPVDTSFVPPEAVPRAATTDSTTADHSSRESGSTVTTGPKNTRLTLVTRLPYRTGRLRRYHADGRHRRVRPSPGGSG